MAPRVGVRDSQSTLCGVAPRVGVRDSQSTLSFKLTCNKFTAEDEASRTSFVFGIGLAPVFGPIATLNSDGDARRMKCFASFHHKPVDFSPRLPLCDVTITHFGATTNAYRRHIDKRIRGVLIGCHAMKVGDTVISHDSIMHLGSKAKVVVIKSTRMAGWQDAEAVLLEVPTLHYEASDFSVWDDNGFGMLSPFGVRIDNAAMRELDFDTDSKCASDPNSNSASDPED